jgi:putative phosphoribosyl transferase
MAHAGVMVFENREEAGQRLAEAIVVDPGEDAVVVGLARGGVVTAEEVARALRLPLDALAVRKVGHPWQPEYGIGAVTPRGGVYIRANDGLTERELADAVAAASRKADELDARLHARRAAIDVAGRTCLLVDDGLATGATMTAAVRWARQRGARRVVVAVPVGAAETVSRLEAEADAVVVLEASGAFTAVGLWYRDFEPVGDIEVAALLDRASAACASGSRTVAIPVVDFELPGDLIAPEHARGAVIFAHGSGSSRLSPRNRLVARMLNEADLATLLFDLLSDEESYDRANVFDIPLLASRLAAAERWLAGQPEGSLPFGYFGASTGAAAALWAAADPGSRARAVVSRGGRPDLAGRKLGLVRAPTLLVVGGLDDAVVELNRRAQRELRCDHELVVVPGATHLFEEPGTLEAVALHAARWFERHLA